MASSKLYFKVDCPHCKKAFATVWNDEIEWTTDAKEALQWRGRQNIDMIAAHDGNVAWPEAAALPVTRWSDDWAEQYECPEAVVARQTTSGARGVPLSRRRNRRGPRRRSQNRRS